jgi:hypothetical protein
MGRVALPNALIGPTFEEIIMFSTTGDGDTGVYILTERVDANGKEHPLPIADYPYIEFIARSFAAASHNVAAMQSTSYVHGTFVIDRDRLPVLNENGRFVGHSD